MTLPSATSGAVRNFSCLPNSVLPATTLSHTISPLSRLIAMTRPSGRLAITKSSHSAIPRVRGALPWCFTPGSHTQTNSPLLGLRASILYTVPQPSVVYKIDARNPNRSEEHTSELQSQSNLVCRLLLEKKKTKNRQQNDSIVY